MVAELKQSHLYLSNHQEKEFGPPTPARVEDGNGPRFGSGTFAIPLSLSFSYNAVQVRHSYEYNAMHISFFAATVTLSKVMSMSILVLDSDSPLTDHVHPLPDCRSSSLPTSPTSQHHSLSPSLSTYHRSLSLSVYRKHTTHLSISNVYHSSLATPRLSL